MRATRRQPVAAARSEIAVHGLSSLAEGLVGSEILRIAAQIRALQGEGRPICNLTVGDFAPSEFRIPAALEKYVAEAFAQGQTSYPPSDGLRELRAEVARLYRRSFDIELPLESI